jgi:hypothetical protein
MQRRLERVRPTHTGFYRPHYSLVQSRPMIQADTKILRTAKNVIVVTHEYDDVVAVHVPSLVHVVDAHTGLHNATSHQLSLPLTNRGPNNTGILDLRHVHPSYNHTHLNSIKRCSLDLHRTTSASLNHNKSESQVYMSSRHSQTSQPS